MDRHTAGEVYFIVRLRLLDLTGARAEDVSSLRSPARAARVWRQPPRGVARSREWPGLADATRRSCEMGAKNPGG